MNSQRKHPSNVGSETTRLGSAREVGVVEVDAAFGRSVGLLEGQKVS